MYISKFTAGVEQRGATHCTLFHCPLYCLYLINIPLSIIGPCDSEWRVAIKGASCESGLEGRVDGVALTKSLAQSRSLDTKEKMKI